MAILPGRAKEGMQLAEYQVAFQEGGEEVGISPLGALDQGYKAIKSRMS